MTEPTAPAPAAHPLLDGREEASAALADAVRRLIGLTMSTTAPADTTMAAARALESVADALERHVPEGPVVKTMLEDPAPGDTDLAGRMPFDNVIGRHNPLALPLTLEFDPAGRGTTSIPSQSGSFDPPRALLRGAFTHAYEGPPGCVHGAVLAATFDIVCAAANFVAGLPGPTARLEIVYRRPTLLHEPCLFEGRVESHGGRRVRTVGRLLQGDRVTVEATGDFVMLDRAQIARMAQRPR